MNRKQGPDKKRLHVKKEHLKELGKDQLAKARGAGGYLDSRVASYKETGA